MSKQQVAFIGLGVMGYPMAGHLATAGYQTRVYNRTAAKAEKWCQDYQGDFASTPREAAEGADFVFMCVGNDDDLRSVVYGDDGVLAGCKEGSILVDHTTASANVAREIADKSPVAFLDAPVSGGQAGAENGVLTVMIGGDQASFEAVRPVIMSYARAAELLGSVGAGQLTKMVNQICIAGLVQGLSEGLNFAQRAGLDGHKVVDVISKGAAGSWQMENRGNTMLNDEFEFGFAVDWMRKDLAICLEESEHNGAELPVTRIVNDFYGEVQEMGGGRWDTSSLIRRLTRKP
jgi:3-hydroxyisobutyrate dehydrogenase-like beta-hydroxyacid dehydrogenase